jgi:hypothetical protein
MSEEVQPSFFKLTNKKASCVLADIGIIDIEDRAETSYLHQRKKTLEPTSQPNKAV